MASCTHPDDRYVYSARAGARRCTKCSRSTEEGTKFVACRSCAFEECLACHLLELAADAGPEVNAPGNNKTRTSQDGLRVGSRVKRGPDWKWGEQDGLAEGTVVKVEDSKAAVEVRWDVSGRTNNYRATDTKHDLKKIGEAPLIGTRVEIGPDWRWENQHGGNKGCIDGALDAELWISVKWDHGTTNRYRWGASEKMDLQVVVGSSGTQNNVIVLNEALPAGASAPSPAARASGTHQTPQPQSLNECPNQHPLTASTNASSTSSRCSMCGTIHVGGAVVNSCAACKFDVCASCMEKPQRKLAAGTLVVRGPDWKWSEQDGGSGTQGSVLGPAPLQIRSDGLSTAGWYQIHWPRTGTKNIYPFKFGERGVCVWEEAPTRGTRVVRGDDWRWGNQDGGAGNQGTIIGPCADKPGWFDLRWDQSGLEQRYRWTLTGARDLRTVAASNPVVSASPLAPNTILAPVIPSQPAVVQAAPEDASGVLLGYERMEVIGRGGFAVVYRARKAGKEVALKMEFVERSSAKAELTAEIALLQGLRHPCVIEVYESFSGKQSGQEFLCTAMQLCKQGDLGQVITSRAQNNSPFAETDVLRVLAQIALAVEFMHSKGVLHRDIKPQNILMLDGVRIVMGDLGVARKLDAGAMAQTRKGTLGFLCPEILSDQPYGFKADVWGIGCTIHAMANGKTTSPFESDSRSALASIQKILNESPSPIPSTYSPDLQRIVNALLTKDPVNRPDARQIIMEPLCKQQVNSYFRPLTPTFTGEAKASLDAQFVRLGM